MSGLNIHFSNRLEVLAHELARMIAHPLSSAFAPETIVVQSKGMEYWLSMRLAENFGICANTVFPFPNAFIDDTFQRVLGLSQPLRFDKEALVWQIMGRLPKLLDSRAFGVLDNYLKGDEQGVKLFQLARGVADAYDQYLIYRPEMVLGWEQGRLANSADPDEAWQAELWRNLAVGEHKARLKNRFLSELGRARNLPERISVFGLSTLPRYHIEILHALSRRLDVHMFLLNPSREAWFHLYSEPEQARISAGYDGDIEDLHLVEGNRLLASLGRQGREFLNLIYGYDPQDHDLSLEGGDDTLLHALQADILNLQEGPARSLDKADDSIRIHVCHSPMREIEVLKDNLLALFESEPNLKPEDIIVMTPEISVYAPYIEAVFAADREHPIPYRIADLPALSTALGDAFLAVLGLGQGRLKASEVAALLDYAVVRNRFGLAESDLATLQDWIEAVGIRWGLDGPDKVRLDLPACEENTWRAGLDRLILGYALPGGGERLFAGILPYDEIEGDNTRVLGAFLDFMTKVFAYATSLAESRPLPDWSALLERLLDDMLCADDAPRDFSLLRGTIRRLADTPAADVTIGPDVVREYLQANLRQPSEGRFLSGGVTFCSLLPMRSIPFTVVCLLGMNGDAYPREQIHKGFDLMVKKPRLGDRSRREDDRYLFLEALLSARAKLWIWYVGLSLRDNTPIPPAVLLSELIDYLEERFTVPSGSVAGAITTQHRLQAFSPAYFTPGAALFSYSLSDCRAAQRLTEVEPDRAFAQERLPEPGPDWRNITAPDLERFFISPVKFFLKERLRIRLDQDTLVIQDREVFALDALSQYQLKQRLAEALLKGKPSSPYDLFKASGLLPHGNLGQAAYENLLGQTLPFVERVAAKTGGAMPEDLAIDLEIDGFRITGRMALYPAGQVYYRTARLKARDYVRAWIRHLLVNATRPLTPSVCLGTDKGIAYRGLDDAGKFLARILALYWQGLSRPLHLFPESSWRYAETKRKDGEDALKAARNVWEGYAPRLAGERAEAYHQLYPGEHDAFDAAFEQIALAFFLPLMDHMTGGAP
ncbi:MAG: exodeoxyribonuclease V subunit gamma [Syntrophaceae bacterium]